MLTLGLVMRTICPKGPSTKSRSSVQASRIEVCANWIAGSRGNSLAAPTENVGLGKPLFSSSDCSRSVSALILAASSVILEDIFQGVWCFGAVWGKYGDVGQYLAGYKQDRLLKFVATKRVSLAYLQIMACIAWPKVVLPERKSYACSAF
jgi:hypothetical protein